MLPRREALAHLCSDLAGVSTTKTDSGSSNNSGHDFTPKEIAIIGSICKQDFSDEVAVKFWAVAFLVWQLADWGAGISAFFHSCPLHGYKAGEPSCKDCCWKGRMSVVLAQGTWLPTFSGQLVNAPPGAAQGFLDNLSSNVSETLIEDFRTCKIAMVQRFQQVYGYWREIPWRLCAVGMPLFHNTPERVAASKAFALDAIEQWNQGKLRDRHHFQMAQKFLDPSHKNGLYAHLVHWSRSPSHDMPQMLAKELMKYTSALTTMQRLEAQHHYVNTRMSNARASLPASLCASLRRRSNKDLETQSFRKHLDKYVESLPKLLAVKWDSRNDSPP